MVRELDLLRVEFDTRHFDIEKVLLRHYQKVLRHIFTERPLSRQRQLLIGAMFSGEYALESAALFNPSIVPHPDQTNLPEGALRFVMSLRATGEGHISSIEFRSGQIAADGVISIDDISRFVTEPEILPNPGYRKKGFEAKLHELCTDNPVCAAVMAPLKENFTLNELSRSIASVQHEHQSETVDFERTLERIEWLAKSNYELRFPIEQSMSERIIFPVSANESNGIEDARFVKLCR